ncbi:hypothetical protein [Dyella flagellata]|uniref:Uncharacterized protein n=1 Tax=Dyella flagellata TaxID=1867833 RepID=A0ABQ5XA17_9GAMM|nr:hypothetical protein [Dyella flagellata]GLQ88484.1 hypothetical protein GCM10007898_20540 [Dyella flagellata]
MQHKRRELPIKLDLFVTLTRAAGRIFSVFLKSWQKHQPPQGGFTSGDGPEYQAFAYVLWFSVLVEIPFMFFLANIVPTLADHRVLIESGLAFLSISALIAFRADRYAIAQTSHSITSDGLHLVLGMRMEGRVPFNAIHSIERIPYGAWRSLSRPWQSSGLVVAKMSPLDKPNVALRVAPGAVELHKMNGSTLYPDIIGLYLDDGDAFIREVRARFSLSTSLEPQSNRT